MRKVKSNALWRGLSAPQQETLDHWLFEEKLSYAAILPRARDELGFRGQISSLKRYYARRDKERTLTRFCTLRDAVAVVSGAPLDEKSLRMASMKLLNEFLFQQVRQSPEKVKEWGMVASLIVENDRNELLRELKSEELRMRRQVMEFARERFQFDVIKRALKALPVLQELAQARKDPATKEYEENIRWNRAIRAVFGPGSTIHPESEQETAEMLAAKRAREARREEEARRLREEEEIIDAQPPTPSSQYYEEYTAAHAARAAQWEKDEIASPPALPAPTDSEKAIEQKLRESYEAQEREREKRELCGWQEVSKPPGPGAS